MSDTICPRGHLSTEPDFCSECGLRIASTVTARPAAAPTPVVEPCPDCGTPRVPGARFCEVCRHDFTAASPKPAAMAPVMPAPPPVAPVPSSVMVQRPVPPPPAPDFGASGNMWVVVSRNPDHPDAAEAAPEPDRAYPLDLAENLVGRRNARRDVHPEIPVGDPSVSARHLKICRRADGSFYGVDVGSSNGTLLNGTALSEGVEAPLAVGDRLALGAYTMLTLEVR